MSNRVWNVFDFVEYVCLCERVNECVYVLIYGLFTLHMQNELSEKKCSLYLCENAVKKWIHANPLLRLKHHCCIPYSPIRHNRIFANFFLLLLISMLLLSEMSMEIRAKWLFNFSRLKLVQTQYCVYMQ